MQRHFLRCDSILFQLDAFLFYNCYCVYNFKIEFRVWLAFNLIWLIFNFHCIVRCLDMRSSTSSSILVVTWVHQIQQQGSKESFLYRPVGSPRLPFLIGAVASPLNKFHDRFLPVSASFACTTLPGMQHSYVPTFFANGAEYFSGPTNGTIL